VGGWITNKKKMKILEMVEKYGVYTTGVVTMVLDKYIDNVSMTAHPEKQGVHLIQYERDGKMLLSLTCDMVSSEISGTWDEVDIHYFLDDEDTEESIDGGKLSDLMEEEDLYYVLASLIHSRLDK
jgi:hypothetical protein